MAFCQEIAFQQGLPRALASLGEVLYAQGHYERAIIYYQDSLERFQKSGNEIEASCLRRSLGFVALRQHRWHEARTHFAESLNIYQKHSEKRGIAACLVGFAGLTERQGQPELAAQLYAASLFAIEVDTPGERAYMEKLALGLDLASSDVERLENMVGLRGGKM